MTNKKIVGISSTGIAAILIAVAFVSYPTQTSEVETFEENFIPGLVPAPIPMSVFLKDNQVKNIDQASLEVGKSMYLPLYLPLGYEVKLISATEKGIKMYASADILTAETTDQEFVWNQKGITINVTPMGESKVAEQVGMQLEQNDKFQPILIDGKIGAGHEIKRFILFDSDEVSSSQAELLFYNGDNKIVVHGLHSLGELAKIAASIP